MAEDTLKHLVIGFMLFTLFGVMVLTAVQSTGTTYGKDTSTVLGGSLSLNRFSENSSSFEDTIKGFKVTFDDQGIWSAIAGVVVEGVFGLGKNMANLILVPFDLLNDIMLDVFHVPVIVSSVILSILIIVIMLGVWQLIKIGN